LVIRVPCLVPCLLFPTDVVQLAQDPNGDRTRTVTRVGDWLQAAHVPPPGRPPPQRLANRARYRRPIRRRLLPFQGGLHLHHAACLDPDGLLTVGVLVGNGHAFWTIHLNLLRPPTGGVNVQCGPHPENVFMNNSFNYVKEAEWVTRPLLDSEGPVFYSFGLLHCKSRIYE